MLLVHVNQEHYVAPPNFVIKIVDKDGAREYAWRESVKDVPVPSAWVTLSLIFIGLLSFRFALLLSCYNFFTGLVMSLKIMVYRCSKGRQFIIWIKYARWLVLFRNEFMTLCEVGLTLMNLDFGSSLVFLCCYWVIFQVLYSPEDFSFWAFLPPLYRKKKAARYGHVGKSFEKKFTG